jgi:IS30 family transposase
MNNQYKQLTLKERYQIEGLNVLKVSARTIVTKMERSNKTIARELRRYLTSKYCAKAAHAHASTVRVQARKIRKGVNPYTNLSTYGAILKSTLHLRL